MTDRGGPATQAGIDFQNAVTALFLGDLLSFESVGSDRVVEVRVEAPAQVDDTVVRFADSRRHWVQAKLALAARGDAWRKLWIALAAQRRAPDFGSQDRLVLVLGSDSALAQMLCSIVGLGQSALSEVEWRARLTRPQTALVSKLEPLASPIYPLLRQLNVQVVTPAMIADREIARRTPLSNVSGDTLHALLRSIAAEGARSRESFEAPALRARLERLHQVRFEPPMAWQLPGYLAELRAGVIAVPGSSVGGAASERFVWPATRLTDKPESDFDDEQDPRRSERREVGIDLRVFPTPQYDRSIVYAGPGFGKSALLTALAARLAGSAERVPAIVSLAALSDSGGPVIDYLQTTLNKEHATKIDWLRLCETGAAVILFDGLDETPLAARFTVIDRVRQFTARFPRASWMLTVRDPSLVPLGFDAQKVELLPLSKLEFAPFIRAVSPDLAECDVGRLVEQILSHPDLERLVRIPLFLALLVATWRPGRPLPAQRSELLEGYLKTLFRPEEHKTARRAKDPERLRAALSALAHALLERGEIGGSEPFIREYLRAFSDAQISTEELFDDAIRCGILRRPSSTRLAFPFPIVQEYLAAQVLLRLPADAIVRHAARAVQRPWAQAIQFALEQHSAANEIATTLLAVQDDAFFTGTRLLARCILSGMACTPRTRGEVGDRLARTWVRQSYFTAQRIGQMLRDGWSSPPSAALREALHRRNVLHEGAGAILADLQDPELTLSVLEAYFERSPWPAHLSDFQTAVDRVAPKAFSFYVAMARANLHREKIWEISSLVGHLDGSTIPIVELDAVVADTELPLALRLAAWGLRGQPPDTAFRDLMERAFKSPEQTDHWPALRGLRHADDIQGELATLLRRPDLGEHLQERVLGELNNIIRDPERRLKVVLGLIEAEGIRPGLRVYLTVAQQGSEAG